MIHSRRGNNHPENLIYQFNILVITIVSIFVYQARWSYQKIGNRIANIIDNQRKQQNKLKAWLHENQGV